MPLTRNVKGTVMQRIRNDATFAQALLDEAATLFLNGEPETARLILRDLVNATIGFEQLATLTAKPSKSLHRMLSPTGNPSMDNLAAIFRAVREKLQVSLQAHSVAAWVRLVAAPGTIAIEIAAKAVLPSEEAKAKIMSRTPMKRLGEPSEIADTVAYPASDEASWITEEIVVVDGGRMTLNYTVAVWPCAVLVVGSH